MSTLSDAQIIALWLDEGGTISTAPEALARALSESSGNTSVTSPNPDGGTNVGLYQLDTKGVGAGNTVAQLSNPYINTQITVDATREGTNWSQWADNWQNFLSQAQSAVSSFTNTQANIQAQLTNVTTGGAGGAGTGNNPPPPPSGGCQAPGGILNKVNPAAWASYSLCLVTQTIENIPKSIGDAILGSFGIKSSKDFFIRFGLIILGGIVLYVGISKAFSISPAAIATETVGVATGQPEIAVAGHEAEKQTSERARERKVATARNDEE